jgi:clan AA aspartic protease (TIGR02281 family)
MGTTFRNILVLLFFALLAAKGVEQFAKSGPGASAQRAQQSAAQSKATYQADEAYISHDQLILRANENGHFTLEGAIDGTSVDFLVDTGATTVVLSPEDASRAGLDPNSLDYNAEFETGNGRTSVALVTLDQLTIGSLDLYDVPAAVITKPMSMSLLGMSALERLEGYEVDGDQMVLRW